MVHFGVSYNGDLDVFLSAKITLEWRYFNDIYGANIVILLNMSVR